MADPKPMFGVPPGEVRVENPDGVFRGMKHNLYDGEPPLRQPVIPGDYGNERSVQEE